MLDERAFAIIADYDGFIAAIVARMTAIGITHEGLEALGFAKGHVGKILAPNRSKNVGPKTFGPLLQLLGIKLIAVEDEKMTAQMRPHWQKREKSLPLLANVRTPPRATWLFSSRSGRKAAKARAEKLSASERHAIALNAITIRWQREREKEQHRCKAVARAPG
jgi:hypothetical protein